MSRGTAGRGSATRSKNGSGEVATWPSKPPEAAASAPMQVHPPTPCCTPSLWPKVIFCFSESGG